MHRKPSKAELQGTKQHYHKPGIDTTYQKLRAMPNTKHHRKPRKGERHTNNTNASPESGSTRHQKLTEPATDATAS
jgi:hypothetical protein